MKRLGIDLGTSSLGWAILDDDRLECEDAYNAIESGVIVFPEGMDREKGQLISPAATRRLKRASRRLIARRRLRKFHILKLLIVEGMCPMSLESLEQWKVGKGYPIDDKPFMEWLAATKESNPYLDRKLAAEEPVDALTLGRAIYHIAQRRGFKSSRKEKLQELKVQTGEEVESTSTAQKELGVVKKEIAELTQRMGNLTLGQYFYNLYEKGEVIRGQKTGRVEHYEKEFRRIAEVQKLSEPLAQKIYDILFFQRPLRIQRHLVGWCSLEKKKKYRRCLVSHPLYEQFCVLSFLNNFRILCDVTPETPNGKRQLTADEFNKLYEKLKRTSAIKLVDLCKELGVNVKTTYRDDVNVPILEVTKRLKNLKIQEHDWQKALNALVDFQDLDKLQAWAEKAFNLSASDARKFVAIDPSTERAPYSLYAIKKILPFLEKGFLLHKALFCANLPTIIPQYDAEKEKEILTAFADAEVAYSLDKQRAETHYQATGRRQKVEPVRTRWEHYLKSVWAVSDADFEKLYVDTTKTDKKKSILPPVSIGAIRNPLALRALTVLRRLVNTLRAEGKIDEDTHITIELAHQINSANMCAAIEKYQKERADERKNARKELAKFCDEQGKPIAITEDVLLRYLLWKEQYEYSVYTGQRISQYDAIFNCDIEHTIPRSRGGTNERVNLTLCESYYNREIKKGRLPTECPNAEVEWVDTTTQKSYPSFEMGVVLKKWRNELMRLERECTKKKPKRGGDAANYNKRRQDYLVLDMKRRYWKHKCDTFTCTKEKTEASGFIPRQMVDTGLITRHAVDYLKQLYEYTYCVNGAATAFARKAWGIQHADEEKNRSDHTHHAVDAMVIAALDFARFNAICTAKGANDYLPDDELHQVCPTPYAHFGEKVRYAQEQILVCQLAKNHTIHPVTPVSIRKNVVLSTPIKKKDGSWIRSVISQGSTVRGSLHDDTLYGRILHKGEERTVIRKPFSADKLSDLNKLINNIVDAAVQKTLREQVQTYIEEYQMQGLSEKEYEKQLCHRPFYAPHKPETKNPPLVKSVRIWAQAKHPDKLRKNVFESHIDAHNYVYKNGGDVLRLELYRNAKGKPILDSVGLLDEALRARGCKEVHQSPEMEIVSGRAVIVHKDDETVEDLKNLTQQELSSRLYYIRKVKGDGRITLWYHREARAAEILSAELKSIGKKGDGESKIDFDAPERLLFLSPSTYLNNLFIEGKDFGITLDGQIEWFTND